MKAFAVYLVTSILLLLVSCAPIDRIVLPERTVNNLNFLYDHVDTEFAFCVFGDVTSRGIEVDHIELPFITAADKYSVTWRQCRAPNFLGIGHSHPKDSECQFSEMDVQALIQTDAPFGFLVCDGRKLVWYGKREVIAQLHGQNHGR